MSKDQSFADLAIQGIPFSLTPPFEFEKIPLPIDVFDMLVSRYVPGRISGWVDYERKEITPVRIRYYLNQHQLGQLGIIELFKTDEEESTMAVWNPSLSISEVDQRQIQQFGLDGLRDLRRKRKAHQAKVVQTLFNLLAKDNTWKKYWSKAKDKWETTGKNVTDDTARIINRIDEIEIRLGEKLDNLTVGQAVIYTKIDGESQAILNRLLKEIQYNRIEQSQIHRTVDAIRRSIKYLQSEGTILDTEVRETLNQISVAANSDLSFNQKLELTLPIIPYLLEYKIELGAGVDLGAVWEELKEIVKISS